MNMTAENNEFCHRDGVNLKEYLETLVEEQIAKLKAVIKAKDELYMTKFADSKEAVQNAFDASQAAITKSEVWAEKRADAVYVSITGLQKALSEVVSRAEFALSNKNVDEKYDILKKSVGDIQILQTKFITTDAYEVRHAELQRQVNDLRESRSEVAGKGIATSALIGWLFGGFGLLVAIISLVLKFTQ
jgi:hypothetical protein